MKKTILAILLSSFFCNPNFANENIEALANTEYFTEEYSSEAEGSEDYLEEKEITSEDSDGYLEESAVESGTFEEKNDNSDCSIHDCDILVEEEDDMLEPLESDVLNFLFACNEYSLEEQIDDHDLNSYLLSCINSLLNENGYTSIDTLPIE